MRYLRGFTLIEMVVTLTILSIITIGLMNFGVMSSTVYVESKHRLDALEEARFLLTRFKRELTNSVPLSPRVLDRAQCIEYIPLLSVVEYNPDSFELDSGATETEVTLMHPVPEEVRQACTSEECRAVIYPRNTSDLYTPEDSENQTYRIEMPSIGTNSFVFESPVLSQPMSSSNRIFIYQQNASQLCAQGDAILYYPTYDLAVAGSGVANPTQTHPFARGLSREQDTFSVGVDAMNTNVANIHFSLAVNNSLETVEFMQNAQILNSQ